MRSKFHIIFHHINIFQGIDGPYGPRGYTGPQVIFILKTNLINLMYIIILQ